MSFLISEELKACSASIFLIFFAHEDRVPPMSSCVARTTSPPAMAVMLGVSPVWLVFHFA